MIDAMKRSLFRIRGSQKALTGSLAVNGAKNDVLKGLAAALLANGPVRIENVPQIEDVLRACELIKKLGVRVTRNSSRSFVIDATRIRTHKLDSVIAQSLRASILFVAPLLARLGTASFPHPGGCVIGKRPIDIFLDGWRAMGIKISVTKSGYNLSIKRLHGCDFTFRTISHTGTEAMMMTAALAHGMTILRNAACEPEVVH
ncbi:MAG: UDP-N-acetylglucosamine 1-carboxyvinyltransferase, partial [Candidatus Ryanbacteria bacterium]|nr:UDP-N-acetylglucosamine 1-carboxyvinyltransferase [Candidatus Ryanbacteria bacterium]